MYKKLSTAELLEWQQQYALKLPATVRGIALKAERERWAYEKVPAQGGKDGLKKIYELPSYLIGEIKEKGLLHLLNDEASPKPAVQKTRSASATADLPPFMREAARDYAEWAEQQDISQIVPVRYHTNVFGSAGPGNLLDEPLETEAMWFRAAFFDYLGVNPARCFCTRVKGDSMHPTLIDRGTVLWQAQNRYTREGIYLFRQYSELKIKRLQRINAHTYQVISDNDNKSIYPTVELDLSSYADYDFEIYGRYLWDCGISD